MVNLVPAKLLIDWWRHLSRNNHELSRELAAVADQQTMAVERLLVCLGLLSQFQKQDVRDAFRQGRIVSQASSEDMLTSIDALREALMPSPHDKFRHPSEFATKLLSQSIEEPLIDGSPLPVRQSFASWRKFLQSLINSAYWDRRKEFPGVCRQPVSQQKTQDKFDRETAFPSHSFEASSPVGSRKKGVVRGKKSQVRIIHSNSSSDSSDIVSESDASISSSGGLSPAQRKSGEGHNDSSIIEVLKSLKFPREIVAPQIYDMSSPTSFKEFLKSFEKYFQNKFHGSDKERSRQLGKFLRGRVKDAYNAMGGDAVKYRELKPMLLKWYGTEKGSSRQRRKEGRI